MSECKHDMNFTEEYIGGRLSSIDYCSKCGKTEREIELEKNNAKLKSDLEYSDEAIKSNGEHDAKLYNDLKEDHLRLAHQIASDLAMYGKIEKENAELKNNWNLYKDLPQFKRIEKENAELKEQYANAMMIIKGGIELRKVLEKENAELKKRVLQLEIETAPITADNVSMHHIKMMEQSRDE